MPKIKSKERKAGKNRLTNRASGLVVGGDGQEEHARPVPTEIDKIAPGLIGMTVPIDSLVPDPLNARLHPERNLAAIMESLDAYGQVKPVVVRKATRVVVAGNGTLAAALALGWTKLAANVVDMTEAEAYGYGLADNRTAELAKWDFEVVARLDALMAEAEESKLIGWSAEEVEVLRREVVAAPPEDFPEVDENIEIEHVCPKCGYRFSGGETVATGEEG